MFKRLIVFLVLAAVSTAAQAQWKRATSDNFIVYSDGNDEALRAFTAKVEAFDSLLRLVSNVKAPPAPKRLEIYLVRNANAVARLLGKGGRNVAGFYAPRLAGAIAVVPRTGGADKFDLDGETVLFHEYAHHFMAQYYPSAYPSWYVEGFAEFYSTAEIDQKGTASIGKPAYHRAYALTLSAPFPIGRLLSDRPQLKGDMEIDAYYGRSWLLAHMLTFSDARKGQLKLYLEAFARGTPAEKAALDAFGPLPQLDRELDRYARERMRYRALSGLDMKVASIAIEPLDPAQDALLLDRLNLRTGIDDTEKQRFLASVRKTAARFPDSPHALDMLVEADLLEGKAAEAAALNDTLIALKPDHAPALLRKAEAMADKAADAEDPKAHWKAIRALIVRANRVNNDDTTALLRYYQAFTREGVTPSKVAVDGLLRAFELAPQASEIRFTLAQQLIHEKDMKAARNILLPIAFAPHGRGEAETARAMISTIDGKANPADSAPEGTNPVKHD